MVTSDQAMEMARQFVKCRTGRECPALDVRKVPGDGIRRERGREYWLVFLEWEPGFDPAILIRIDADDGAIVQEEVL